MAQGAILKFAFGAVLLMGGMLAGIAANAQPSGDQANAGASQARV